MADDVTIRFGGNVAGFQKATSLVKNELGGLKKTAAKAFAVGIGAVGVKALVDDLDRLSKVSRRLQLPIGDLMGLRHAADLAGVEGEHLFKVITKLNRRTAGAGEFREVAAGLRELGINAKEFGRLSVDKKMIALADAVHAANDPAATQASLFKVLARDADALIDLLNQGGAAIQEAADMATKATEAQGLAAERLNDALTQLKSKVTGLAPAVELLGNALTGLQVTFAYLGTGASFSDVVDEVAEGLAAPAEKIDFLVEQEERLAAAIKKRADSAARAAAESKAFAAAVEEGTNKNLAARQELVLALAAARERADAAGDTPDEARARLLEQRKAIEQQIKVQDARRERAKDAFRPDIRTAAENKTLELQVELVGVDEAIAALQKEAEDKIWDDAAQRLEAREAAAAAARGEAQRQASVQGRHANRHTQLTGGLTNLQFLTSGGGKDKNLDVAESSLAVQKQIRDALRTRPATTTTLSP
jgi:hypothetical protein